MAGLLGRCSYTKLQKALTTSTFNESFVATVGSYAFRQLSTGSASRLCSRSKPCHLFVPLPRDWLRNGSVTAITSSLYTSSCVASERRKPSRAPKLISADEVQDKAAATTKVKVRSLTLRSNIAQHDFEVKLAQVAQWLCKGQSVSVSVAVVKGARPAHDSKTGSSSVLDKILTATKDKASFKFVTKTDTETVIVLTPNILATPASGTPPPGTNASSPDTNAPTNDGGRSVPVHKVGGEDVKPGDSAKNSPKDAKCAATKTTKPIDK